MRSNANTATRQKGKGWFVNEHGIIYVQGSVDKKFKRKSTGLKSTAGNIAYIKKNYRDVLLQKIDEDKVVIDTDFASFGLAVIESGAKKVDKHGKHSRRGRGELAQRDALSKFENYILPFFKEYSLEEIKPMHVETWLSGILEQKSTSTAHKCKNLLGEIMHKACANDLVQKNPVDYVDRVEVSYEKQEAYSLEDALKMMRASTGWMHTYLNLAFTTGMRTGELLALKWEDIDWEHSCIYLQRSVSKGRMSYGSAGKKNHSRIVPLMPQILKILKDAKEDAWSEWMFPSRKGSYYRESKSIVKYHFKPLLEKLGVEYISLYATRHTFSTIVDNLRVDTSTVDSMVGNSEKVRQDHYVTFQMTKERAAEAQGHLAPVNNVFFNETMAKVK
jgi:integrase